MLTRVEVGTRLNWASDLGRLEPPAAPEGILHGNASGCWVLERTWVFIRNLSLFSQDVPRPRALPAFTAVPHSPWHVRGQQGSPTAAQQGSIALSLSSAGAAGAWSSLPGASSAIAQERVLQPPSKPHEGVQAQQFMVHGEQTVGRHYRSAPLLGEISGIQFPRNFLVNLGRGKDPFNISTVSH